LKRGRHREFDGNAKERESKRFHRNAWWNMFLEGSQGQKGVEVGLDTHGRGEGKWKVANKS